MMRIIILLLALLAGLFFGPEISANKGYIIISFDAYTTYELTIVNAVFIIVAFYFLLQLVEWLLSKLLSMSAITRGWLGKRKTRQAQKNSILGMLALFEGKSKQAQKLLASSAARSESPALTYIAAAKAAHSQGKYELRDEHLLQACESQKGSELAAGLVGVELQLEALQYGNALARLDELDKRFPKNQRISELYLSIYPALNQWQKYLQLLSKKRCRFTFSEAEFATKQLTGYQQLFKQLALRSAEQLQEFWDKNVARKIRKELSYQKAVLDAYIEAGDAKFAGQFLSTLLNKEFNIALLGYLGKVEISEPATLIKLLESKLNKESQKGLIHQALAKLKLKTDATTVVIAHLKESLKTDPTVEDFALLCKLLEKDDCQHEAQKYYRQGLQFAASAK